MSLKTPPIDPKTVEWLRERFPNRLPDPGISLRDVDRLIGQQEVIRLLMQELGDQQENVLIT